MPQILSRTVLPVVACYRLLFVRLQRMIVCHGFLVFHLILHIYRHKHVNNTHTPRLTSLFAEKCRYISPVHISETAQNTINESNGCRHAARFGHRYNASASERRRRVGETNTLLSVYLPAINSTCRYLFSDARSVCLFVCVHFSRQLLLLHLLFGKNNRGCLQIKCFY